MKNYFLFQIFKSKYCWFSFLLSLLIIGIVIPKKIFYGYYNILGITFVLISSILITCFVRNIKERVVLAKKQRTSFLGIIFLVIGLVTMSTCSVGGPICGATIVGGVVGLFFPGFMLTFLSDYSMAIILFSLIIQIIALYFMNCFKEVNLKCK